MCSRIKNQEKQIMLLTRKKKVVETVYGGDNSIDSENAIPD
jgi:hypothetical protein